VIVGTTGPIGSGLPQLGLPRRFAIVNWLPALPIDLLMAQPPKRMSKISSDPTRFDYEHAQNDSAPGRGAVTEGIQGGIRSPLQNGLY
jgi:hypothetical protein